jgi:ketosteroid isomerase-like protein
MSDIEKINTYYLDFMEAVRQGDGEKCASMCDENAVFLPPNEPPLKGRDAIRQLYANLGSDSTLNSEALKTEVSGGLAYQQSRVTWESNGKTKYTDTLDVLKQQDDGSWLFVACAWNSAEGIDQV